MNSGDPQAFIAAILCLALTAAIAAAVPAMRAARMAPNDALLE